MKRRHVRAGARWAGTLGCLLWAAAWVWSCWCWLAWTHHSQAMFMLTSLGRGAIHAAWQPVNSAVWAGVAPFSEFQVTDVPPRERFRTDWKPSYKQALGTKAITVPLWLPLVLTLAPTAWLWGSEVRRRRAVRAGSCPSCGYDRRGLVGGADVKCPECGTVPTK
jgi:hypothetical protein